LADALSLGLQNTNKGIIRGWCVGCFWLEFALLLAVLAAWLVRHNFMMEVDGGYVLVALLCQHARNGCAVVLLHWIANSSMANKLLLLRCVQVGC
jgi:hypothetical protein